MPPRRTIAAGRFLHLVEEGGWEFAERRNASGVVAVVAVTPDNRLLLTRQRRTAVGTEVIDLPAGLAGDDPGAAGERLEQAARRELVEETGWDAERFERLTAGPPSPGLSSEIVALYR
ncbi:MAG: NUDIX hydrolase, partial [Planctomycetes bacterium]|nr:NUDIX hydrolase [Planctomycetota bacterium]